MVPPLASFSWVKMCMVCIVFHFGAYAVAIPDPPYVAQDVTSFQGTSIAHETVTRIVDATVNLSTTSAAVAMQEHAISLESANIGSTGKISTGTIVAILSFTALLLVVMGIFSGLCQRRVPQWFTSFLIATKRMLQDTGECIIPIVKNAISFVYRDAPVAATRQSSRGHHRIRPVSGADPSASYAVRPGGFSAAPAGRTYTPA